MKEFLGYFSILSLLLLAGRASDARAIYECVKLVMRKANKRDGTKRKKKMMKMEVENVYFEIRKNKIEKKRRRRRRRRGARGGSLGILLLSRGWGANAYRYR